MKTQRNRAWRRLQRARVARPRASARKECTRSEDYCSKFKPVPDFAVEYRAPKRWGDMGVRSQKLSRAKQLGFVYPVRFELHDEYLVRL